MFLDADKGEIREVNFNKNKYDEASKKYLPDAEKAAEVDKWCEEYFQTAFEELAQCIGDRKDIFCYDRFNSLWEVKMISKFDDEMVGQIFEWNAAMLKMMAKKSASNLNMMGNCMQSKMQYADYLDARKECVY